ncbi:hypothetical protein K7X08_024567 [Anisodus acutangulus]|uniref:Uncharacterized protein n=1 Tax=Anisodus acutangulus TaxID=402998 RepID=A0A9Q1MB37_9SOLA|nr:hypothetical protein K7X08_024567 [Anisodus acutangulus]
MGISHSWWVHESWVGTGDASECRQKANSEDFQEISMEQVTPLVNLDDGPVVSTGKVNEHTNVASRHLVGNIISYKRKKKLCVASPPHSEVHAQNEQGESVEREERTEVHVSVVLDPIEATSKEPATEQLSAQLQSFIGDGREGEGDSVSLQSNGVQTDAKTSSE